jgi:hypothetical protein
MTGMIEEAAAARLERSGGRALRLLADRNGTEAAFAAQESGRARTGAPDQVDRNLIAASLALHWDKQAPAALVGRDHAHEARLIAQDLIEKANAALELLREDGVRAPLHQDQAMALESVLMVRGRPSLQVRGKGIEPVDDVRHPGSGIWRIILSDYERALAKHASAVAAVMVKYDYPPTPEIVVGTAWLVRPDLAITNRHVLLPETSLRLARRRPGEPTQARIKSDLNVCLDFAHDNGPGRAMRYLIDEIVYVTRDEDPIDAALLRVRPLDPAVSQLPQPLALAREGIDEWDSDRVCVVGHPGRMAQDQITSEIAAVFGNPDGRKRISFGELMDPDERRRHDLVYDSSTIGGFSGGPVAPVGTGEGGVVGLHYWGGDVTTGNRAILARSLREHPLWALLA